MNYIKSNFIKAELNLIKLQKVQSKKLSFSNHKYNYCESLLCISLLQHLCVVLLRNPFDEVHHFKAAQNLIKIIQIHYCFGLGIDK